MHHEQQTKVRTDESAAAKSHDRHSCRHTWTIRKPFHQSRNRRNVTQAETATADHPITKIDDPKLVPPNAKSGNDKAAAKTKSGSEHRLARANAFNPAPKHCRRKSQEENGQTENPCERWLRPITWCGLGNTNDFSERQFKNAERINLSN